MYEAADRRLCEKAASGIKIQDLIAVLPVSDCSFLTPPAAFARKRQGNPMAIKTDPWLATWVAVSFASVQICLMIEDAFVVTRAGSLRASAGTATYSALLLYTAATSVVSVMLPIVVLLSLMPAKLTGSSKLSDLASLAKLEFAAGQKW
jgi:hypothetical protein